MEPPVVAATSVWVRLWGAELPDERSLPGHPHRMPVIVRPHERHRVCRRDAVGDGDAGQGCAGAAPTTRARHLDSLEHRAPSAERSHAASTARANAARPRGNQKSGHDSHSWSHSNRRSRRPRYRPKFGSSPATAAPRTQDGPTASRARSGGADRRDRLDLVSHPVLRDLQVVPRLQVQPELRVHPEVPSKAKGSVG